MFNASNLCVECGAHNKQIDFYPYCLTCQREGKMQPKRPPASVSVRRTATKWGKQEKGVQDIASQYSQSTDSTETEDGEGPSTQKEDVDASHSLQEAQGRGR